MGFLSANARCKGRGFRPGIAEPAVEFLVRSTSRASELSLFVFRSLLTGTAVLLTSCRLGWWAAMLGRGPSGSQTGHCHNLVTCVGGSFQTVSELLDVLGDKLRTSDLDRQLVDPDGQGTAADSRRRSRG